MSVTDRRYATMTRLRQLLSDNKPENSGQQWADVEAMLSVASTLYLAYHRVGEAGNSIQEATNAAMNALDRYRASGESN